jgi:AcrR family transcriptional regulator
VPEEVASAPRVDARGAQTKAALLEAAKRLILERGYAGASVRELTAAAGANLGAVNYHFGSREKLLNEAMLDFFTEWGGRVGDVDVDAEAEPLKQFAERSRPLVEGIPDAQPAFVMALEALLQSRRSPELHTQFVEHSATPRGRELPPRYLEVAASYIIAVVDGLQLQALLDPTAIPTADELAFFYESLAAAARAAGQPSTEQPSTEESSTQVQPPTEEEHDHA